MTYYLRFGRTFFFNVLILVWAIFVLMWQYPFDEHVSGPGFNLYHSIFYYLVMPMAALFAGISFYKICLFLYLGIFKKPAFTASEDYMFDHVKNIKYSWEDINEVEGAPNSLTIYLYQPDRYLVKINNPFYRLLMTIEFAIFDRKSLYSIKLSLLNMEEGEYEQFLEKLNKFSLGEAE